MRRAGPRFTIRSLMISVAAAAGLLALFLRMPIQIVAALIFVPFHGVLIGVLWGMFRRFRRVARLCFGVVAVFANFASAALCIYRLSLGGVVLIGLGWLITFPIIIGAGSGWATAAMGATVRSRRSTLSIWPLVIVPAFAPLSMLFTPWPLHLAFLVSRPAMERLADRVAAEQGITRAEWAGLFRVVGSAVDPAKGNVGLIIDPDPSGRSGFVRLGPDVSEGDTYGPFFNLNFDEHLGGRWFYQNED